jgi:hypothetical protein
LLYFIQSADSNLKPETIVKVHCTPRVLSNFAVVDMRLRLPQHIPIPMNMKVCTNFVALGLTGQQKIVLRW